VENKKINYYEIADKMAFEEYHFQFDGLYKLSEREVQFIAGVMSNDILRLKIINNLVPDPTKRAELADNLIKEQGLEVIENDWGENRVK
jgi:hypothetical protein